MKTLLILTLTTAITTSGLLACSPDPTERHPSSCRLQAIPVKKTMQAFKSEEELTQYLRELAEKQRREQKRVAKMAFSVAQPAMADARAGKLRLKPKPSRISN